MNSGGRLGALPLINVRAAFFLNILNSIHFLHISHEFQRRGYMGGKAYNFSNVKHRIGGFNEDEEKEKGERSMICTMLYGTFCLKAPLVAMVINKKRDAFLKVLVHY